jgi:arylsulfatase A-like enzyme
MHRRGARYLVILLTMAAVGLPGMPQLSSGTATASSGAVVASPQRAADQRPNIVFITTDDQTLAEMRWMPQTRQVLGGAGARFTDFVAPHPLCCPSRAQMLTGQYAQNNRVRHNAGPFGGYHRFRPATALPVWLQNAGYRTALVGKYLNGYHVSDGIEVGWDYWNPKVPGLYLYFGFQHYDNGTVVEPDGYHTDYVAEQTRRLVGQYAAGSEPFFIWSSYVAPHGVCTTGEEVRCKQPPLPAPEYADSYSGVRAPFLDSPSFNEKDVRDKPGWVVRNGKVAPKEMQTLFTQRIRTLASVDDAVAGIVDALDDAGVLDNTLVVFTSDNGFLFGEHRAVGKDLAYEEAVRVPLLMRGPGIPAGVTRRQSTAMIDLAPTFAAVAGAQPLVEVDGRSLLGYAWRDAPQRDRTVLVQAGPKSTRDIPQPGWMYRGVRTGRYTFVHWKASDVVELYDRSKDPYELHNLAKSARYRTIRTELAKRTRQLGGCSGDSCRVSFGRLPPPAARR